MELDTDGVREEDDGYYVECPSCGTPTKLMTIIETGRCANAEATGGGCDAEISIELVWDA
jgi:hypothetical protein